MFVDFLFALRRQGVAVTTTEWLDFHRALRSGLIDGEGDLYGLGRALLVHDEGRFDAYDLAFAETFRGLQSPELHEALRQWLEAPLQLGGLDPEAFERLTGLSLDELRKRFEEILKEQKERHDGGRKWIGTGGTSPFGQGGAHPTGIRVGEGGGRSAVQVAEERRFRNYRTDEVLDVRQFQAALRQLRLLARDGREELDIDDTIDATAKDAGEIALRFRRDRKNRVRMALLMDAGGSMEPYARLVDQLFTAAHKSQHWKEFRHFFFHNCPYGRLYTDIQRWEAAPTDKVLRELHPDTKVLFVGDACMAPWELTATGGAISLIQHNALSGWEWMQRFRRTFAHIAWLNPEPERYWTHPTIAAIGGLVPMYPLSVDGLRDAVKGLRRGAAKAAARG